MPVKTITIDMEAYALLAAQKQKDESFSKLIKRRLRPSRTADALLKDLKKFRLSEDSLNHIESRIQARADSIADSPLLDKAH